MENFSVIGIRDAIVAGELTAAEAVETCLATIAKKDGDIGAFLEVFEEDARKAADVIDAKKAAGEMLGRLAGVPIAIKDNILIKGQIASAGSKMLAEYHATYHATVIDRLLKEDAILIGRTNMDEFAMGSSTETSAYNKTRNPWDTQKIPGGSSGGSAAAVAAGMVPAALGTDTGGSIRQPAALCGVVGMKPTYGRVPRYGAVALASSLDQIGPIARTVEDVALILEVIEGADIHDATTVNFASSTVAELMEPSFAGMKIGVPKEYFLDSMDTDVKARVEEAIELMKAQGAEVKEISLPLTEYALPAYYIIQPAEASSNLARFDGMRYGTRAEGPLKESYRKGRSNGFGREVKRRIMLGNYILSAGYYDAYYKKALAVKTAIFNDLNDALKDVDVIVSPASPSVAWNIDEKFNDPIAMYLSDVYTVTANITGVPAISVPCGFAHDLPVGVQFMAGVGEDAKVLLAAAAYQHATDWETIAT